MQKNDPIIRTKLRLPFTRLELVSRPRLQEQVIKGLNGPLTLVTAPAGFGKTTLVTSCVAKCGMPVAWLSLDKDDNLASRFLNYLVATFQEADNRIGCEAAQLAAISQVQSEAILTSVINDLDNLGKEIVLVLDDYHFISNQGVHLALTFLLEHCPQTLHLVIASRSDPPLPLARLRARGQAVELRAVELRFTELETSQFLNNIMGLHLDEGSIALLEKRTEGWIAGLQMAALSMRNRQDVVAFVEGFSGTNRYILDYLMEEVLVSQPPEIQHFLLCTSILKRLTAPLCNVILETEEELRQGNRDQTSSSEIYSHRSSASILEYLERANIFLIPLDDERRWYRYHHLFADLLQARLYQSGHNSISRLLVCASEWCEQNEHIADAVSYAFAAQDYGRATHLIEKYWAETVDDGEIETVQSWLNALPQETLRNSAQLNFAFCWVLWLKGEVGAIEPYLIDAEHAQNALATAESGKDTHDDIPVHLAILRSIVARFNNDFETAITLAERAIRLIPADLPNQAGMKIQSLGFLALASACDGAGEIGKAADAYAEVIRLSRLCGSATGIGVTCRMTGVLRLLGRLRAADEACRDALQYLQEQGLSRMPSAGVLFLMMSELCLERNELDTAQAHLTRGFELGKWDGRFAAVRNAAPAFARLRQVQHDLSGALIAVQEAEAAHDKLMAPLAVAELLALKARLLARQGALAEAEQCLDESARLARQDRGLTGQILEIATVRVMLAQGKLDEAIARLTRSLNAAETSGWLGAVLEMRILRCLAFMQRGDFSMATADLEQALVLAKAEGYVRIFLDEGRPMRQLLTQWLAKAGNSPLREYALQLLSQFDSEPQPVSLIQERVSPADNLIEPLSRREMEVLCLMAQGRTNQEIARQLVVAPGTIKAHTASIYRKLDAANRTEAVAHARQFGLLP